MILTSFFILTSLFFFVALFNAVGWPKPRQADRTQTGVVSILIPARNEEKNLAACLDSILKQGEIVREIIVYDDHSTDGTASIVSHYKGIDGRIRLARTLPLESGWCGKNFACSRLAAEAEGDWLLFVDADTSLLQGAASRMVNEMQKRRLKLLSCWPGLEMITFWEKALMPVLNFVVFSIFPAPFSLYFFWPSLAIAHGACLMFDKKSYFEIGGHSAVRDQIFEDVRLAQMWRSSGSRGLCLDGQDLVRVRMYSSFSEIWKGFQKNFYPAFRYELSFWIFILFHFTVFLLPFILLVVMPNPRIMAACLAIILTRLLLAAYFRQPLWSALLHPLTEAITLALGISSWWCCKTGQGVAWKGREYHKSSS